MVVAKYTTGLLFIALMSWMGYRVAGWESSVLAGVTTTYLVELQMEMKRWKKYRESRKEGGR